MQKMAVITFLLIACIIFTGTYYIGKDKPLTIIDYTVTNGETLWSIYERYDNGQSWDKWRYEVKKLNGKETSGLDIGEVVKIYVEVSE